MAVNAFFVKDSGLPRERGLVNDIAFTSLGRLWIGQAEWALSGGNTLICASMTSMLAEGVQQYCGTTETLVAHKAHPVMYCPQVVNDGSLIFPILPAPRAVSVTGEMPEGIGVMDPL